MGAKHRLPLNIIAALSLCTLLASAVLINEFKVRMEDSLQDALTGEAREIIGQIDPAAPWFGLDPETLRFRGNGGKYRYTVFDGSGKALVGGEASPRISAQLETVDPDQAMAIELPGDRIGLGMRARVGAQDVLVLVSTYLKGKNETAFQELWREMQEEIRWIALGVLMVLAAAILATRRALSPLDGLSDQARQIGPPEAHERLASEHQVPTEIAPLIDAVNGAFDRLEQGYQAQRDFSSNVAHEVRTPIAVLRSSVERIDDPDLRQSLSQDVAHLDRLFHQLIDLARADTAPRSADATLDLRDLAVEIASDIAQEALSGGHTLAVTGATTAIAQGNRGLLGIAMRNVIRNALQYSPKGSDVEIEILDTPPGWQVLDRGAGVPNALKPALFERFNRGAQANTASKGSGIGLAIVESVAKSHAATVSVADRDGGGSVFSFRFEA